MIKLITVFIITFIISSCSKATMIDSDVSVQHIITPDSSGRINMYPDQTQKILPGSTIYLDGNFLSVHFTGLKGSAEHPIRITNYPGKKLVIGNPDWAGGAYSSAIQLLECQHIILGSENDAADF